MQSIQTLKLVALGVGQNFDFFSFMSWSATRHSKIIVVHNGHVQYMSNAIIVAIGQGWKLYVILGWAVWREHQIMNMVTLIPNASSSTECYEHSWNEHGSLVKTWLQIRYSCQCFCNFLPEPEDTSKITQQNVIWSFCSGSATEQIQQKRSIVWIFFGSLLCICSKDSQDIGVLLPGTILALFN